METIYLDVVELDLVNGDKLRLKDVRYSQKGTIMMFEDVNEHMTIVNFDNVLYFTYIEKKQS